MGYATRITDIAKPHCVAAVDSAAAVGWLSPECVDVLGSTKVADPEVRAGLARSLWLGRRLGDDGDAAASRSLSAISL
jgi:hypothetical protein